jgi:hypothetical protein
VADILFNGNLYGNIANVYFISIIFHIADPCSLSYGQTIKRTSQLQYIRIYLEKCRDKNCMIIFKIENPFHELMTTVLVQYLFHLPFEYKHTAK